MATQSNAAATSPLSGQNDVIAMLLEQNKAMIEQMAAQQRLFAQQLEAIMGGGNVAQAAPPPAEVEAEAEVKFDVDDTTTWAEANLRALPRVRQKDRGDLESLEGVMRYYVAQGVKFPGGTPMLTGARREQRIQWLLDHAKFVATMKREPKVLPAQGKKAEKSEKAPKADKPAKVAFDYAAAYQSVVDHIDVIGNAFLSYIDAHSTDERPWSFIANRGQHGAAYRQALKDAGVQVWSGEVYGPKFRGAHAKEQDLPNPLVVWLKARGLAKRFSLD